jgi:hypothetical protein
MRKSKVPMFNTCLFAYIGSELDGTTELMLWCRRGRPSYI